MYDVPDFYLVANPIDRYSIGDRTPGLVTRRRRLADDRDQHDEPSEPDERANWLPAPAGTFRPVLRMYEPDDAVFDGGYKLPPIPASADRRTWIVRGTHRHPNIANR